MSGTASCACTMRPIEPTTSSVAPAPALRRSDLVAPLGTEWRAARYRNQSAANMAAPLAMRAALWKPTSQPNAVPKASASQ
jgi:hypothetical protein